MTKNLHVQYNRVDDEDVMYIHINLTSWIDFSLHSNGVPNKRQKCDIDLTCDTGHKTSANSRGVAWFSVLGTHTKA